MRLNRINRYRMLQVFGDAKPHTWNEVVWFCIVREKLKPKEIKSFLRMFVINHGLIKRVGLHNDLKMDSLIITKKGDECLRSEQIARDGDPIFYKNFDRTTDGKWGLNKFVPIPKGYTKT